MRGSWWIATRQARRRALIFRCTAAPGPLGSDHQHVEVGAGLDQIEAHVEAVANISAAPSFMLAWRWSR